MTIPRIALVSSLLLTLALSPPAARAKQVRNPTRSDVLRADQAWIADASRDPGQWQALLKRETERRGLNTAKAREMIAKEGSEAPALKEGCFADLVCEAVTSAAPIVEGADGERLERARLSAQKRLELFDLQLATFGKLPHDGVNRNASEALIVMGLRDQFIRASIVYWEYTPAAGEEELSRDLTVLGLTLRAIDSDLSSLAAYEQISGSSMRLDLQGLTPAAKDAAWLTIQHGDRRPELQVRALKNTGRTKPDARLDGDLAYLEDRVGLALRGRQVYGTQLHCSDGRLRPLNVLEPATLDARRAAKRLEPIDQYISRSGSSC